MEPLAIEIKYMYNCISMMDQHDCWLMRREGSVICIHAGKESSTMFLASPLLILGVIHGMNHSQAGGRGVQLTGASLLTIIEGVDQWTLPQLLQQCNIVQPITSMYSKLLQS